MDVRDDSREHNAPSEPIATLRRLRGFEGGPTAFWPVFLEAMAEVAGAPAGAIVIDGKDGWKAIAVHPKSAKLWEMLRQSGFELEAAARQALQEKSLVVPLARADSRSGVNSVLLVDVTPVGTSTSALVLLGVADDEASELAEARLRVQLGAESASVYSLQRRLDRAEDTMGSFASVLDLLRVIDSRHRYLEAAMTLCNEVASRFQCERVSLGWLTKGSIRLQAISHSEKIERKMAAVIALEELMEESLDQDEEVVVPVPAGSTTLARIHERYAAEQRVPHLASLPLRLGDEVTGVLSVERSEEEFGEAELRSLRMLCDQVATRLHDLRKHDRWIGARCWSSIRGGAAKLVGVEHTGWKLVGLAGAVALAVLIFGGGMYRVEAPFIMKSDTLAQVPAAMDGYIRDVQVHIGDVVEEGAALLELDRRQLLLEESSALAELRRHRSDAQRSEAEGELSKMQSSLAQAEQVEARLEIVRYRLEQSRMKAPFDGVVVEGDLRERIGAPVQQGEVLLKIARLDQLVVEGKVDERNIHLLKEGSRGEIAFASRPQDRIPVVVERIEPLAIAEEEGNVFIVRCRTEGEASDWWRPGMSGLCKIETERRSYLWMLTHRTVEFLRMKLWW